ncbi:MAG: CdaR family protein [Bacillota bacterium]|nr:CdaR family protein [Bacillota bacterium]
MFKSNGSLKIISLLVAVCLWLYVIGEVDPEMRAKISNVPVSLVNTEVLTEQGLAAIYEEKETINVTISGSRSDINDAKKNGLTASVDVTNFDKGKNEGKITVNLPTGISLYNSSDNTMTVVVKERVTEVRNVEISFDDTNGSAETVSETTPWVLDYYPHEVTVSGANSSVDKVDKVVGVINPSRAVADKSKWVGVDLVPVDEKGNVLLGIDLSFDSGEAKIRLLNIKMVDLTVSTVGKDIDLDEIGTPERVRIVGEEKAIADIDNVKGTAALNEDGKVNITVELPENVYLMIGEDDGKIIWN